MTVQASPSPSAAGTETVEPVVERAEQPGAPWLVPDLVGLGLPESTRVARTMGLRLSVEVLATKVGPWGLVLSQSPEPGSATAGGTRIEVTVAGRPHLAVPDVRTLPLTEAMAVLRRAGLEPVVVEERPARTVSPGHVLESRPRPGALVPDRSRIELCVARSITRRR